MTIAIPESRISFSLKNHTVIIKATKDETLEQLCKQVVSDNKIRVDLERFLKAIQSPTVVDVPDPIQAICIDIKRILEGET